MAITISNSNANISDTTLSYTLSYNRTSGSQTYGLILVNGTVIGSNTTTSTSSISVSITASALYNAATGKSLSGAVTFRVQELDSSGNPVSASDKTGGNITINARLSSFSVADTANPYNLDSPTNISASWTRPHTAFRGRLLVSINGTTVIDRLGFTTSANFDPVSLGHLADMIAAMSNSSPRDIVFTLQTGFVANSTVYYTGGTGNTITRTNGVVKQFLVNATVSSFPNFSIGSNPTVNLNIGASTAYHRLVFKVGATEIGTFNLGTGSGGTITFTNTNHNNILGTFTNGNTSKTVTVEVYTFQNSNYTTQIGSTQTATATASISPSTISNFVNFSVEGSSTFSLSSNYSGLTYSIEYRTASAQIKSYTGTGGTSFDTAQKNIIYSAFTSGATSTTITLNVSTMYGSVRIGTIQTATAQAQISASSLGTLTNFTMTIGTTVNACNVSITKSSNSFTHDVIIKLGSHTVKTHSGVMTSSTTTFQTTLDSIEQDDIYTRTLTSMSAILTYELVTKYGSTQIGSTSTRTVTANFPSTLVPTFSSISISPVGSTTIYVQNVSKVLVTIVGPAGIKSSTISSMSFTFNGTTYPYSSAVTTNTITSSGTLPIVATVTDTRGQSYTGPAQNVIVQAYNAPSITSFSVNRYTSEGALSPTGDRIKITANVAASSVTGNTMLVKFSTRLRPAGTWSDDQTIQSGTTLSYNSTTGLYATYSASSSYDIKLEVIDVYRTTTQTIILSTGAVPMSFSKTGVGIGKIWQQGALDVQGDIYQNGSLLKGTEFRSNTNTWLSGQVTLQQGSNVTLSQSGNTITVAATDTNTTYSAGNGIGLSGTAFSVAAGNGLTQETSGLALGTPGSLTGATTNATTATSHTHAVSLTAADVGAVPTTRTVTAGNGMAGGGALSANITITLGTPSTIGTGTTNSVTTTSHTHSIDFTGIHSSGTVTNGSWIRFHDGTQICVGQVSWTTAVATAWGGMFTSGTTYSTLTFPATFTRLDSWSLVAHSTTGPMPAYGYPMALTTSNFTYFIGTAVSTTSRAWTVRYILTGRWT